jgi:hypothetical protein
MVAVNYLWDELEDNIDEEYDDSGNSVAEYTTEPDRIRPSVNYHDVSKQSSPHDPHSIGLSNWTVCTCSRDCPN